MELGSSWRPEVSRSFQKWLEGFVRDAVYAVRARPQNDLKLPTNSDSAELETADALHDGRLVGRSGEGA